MQAFIKATGCGDAAPRCFEALRSIVENEANAFLRAAAVDSPSGSVPVGSLRPSRCDPSAKIIERARSFPSLRSRVPPARSTASGSS